MTRSPSSKPPSSAPAESTSSLDQDSITIQKNSLFSPPLLSRVERWGIHLMHTMVALPWGVRLGMGWTRIFGKPIVSLLSKPRWRVHGIEQLDQLSKTDPILLIANHRTFFDLFVIMTALRTQTSQRLGMRCVFPVRAPFDLAA